MPLPDGLTVAVSARVDCRFYNPVKKTRVLSAAGRAAMVASGQRLAARRNGNAAS